MKRAFLAATSLLLLASLISAQADKPKFPVVKVGFDDGRTDLLREVEVSNLDVERLFERIFEDWHRADVAAFLARHTTGEERRALDKLLKLENVLAVAENESALADALSKSKLAPTTVAGALGKLLSQREYTTADCCAWLYARDINCAAQLKYAGSEAFHPYGVRKTLRELSEKNKPAGELFALGLWEFDARDGLLTRGGHYDAVQLVENLFALGWGVAEFAKALKREPKSLPTETVRLIEWQDAALLVPVLDGKISEAELAKFAQSQAGPADKLLTLGLLRAQCMTRWFRSSGAGIVAVYGGPMPAKDRLTPSAKALEMPEDPTSFADELDDSMTRHFAPGCDWLTVVLYEDGGARAFVRYAGESFEYGPDSPLGAGKHSVTLYEGRASATAKAGAFTQVFAPKGSNCPRIDLAGLVLPAGGALLSASIEDGAELRPILLRRIPRCVPLE